MAFIKIPEEILDADITAAQFRVIVNLIKYSFDDGHSYIGYTKLAAACKTDKSAVIKSIKELERRRFLTVSQRGKFNRSNDIKLTLDEGLKSYRPTCGDFSAGETVGGVCEPSTVLSLNTPKGCQNTTPQGCLKPTLGCQNTTPHKDIRFKYLDLNLNTRETGCLKATPGANSNYIAPDDVASGRTMPGGDADTVAENSAKEVGAAPTQTELEDFCLVSAFFEAFPELEPWVRFSKVGGYFALQPIGKLGKQRLDGEAQKVSGWFALRGAKLVFEAATKVLKGQILRGA